MQPDCPKPEETAAGPPRAADGPMEDQKVEERRAHSPFPIVGIGASAGGLEAFTQFLGHLPDQTGMAFVLVQHLAPRHESRLADVLSRATRMPVVQATQGLAVRPDSVYIIPPNTNLAIAQGALQVTPRAEAHRPHLPVDHFLRALAQAQQAQAIGVVLSGTGSDGTLGLSEIKAVGGISFAQEPESARHGGMPQSAIDSGVVDFVLPPERIAERLGTIGAHPYLAPTPTAGEEEQPLESKDHFKRILTAVYSASGVDFSLYRDTTIRCRIMRRMALHGQQVLADYARRLETDGGEVETLYRDLLISVTSFFRDPDLFETLKESVFPEIWKNKSPATPIRIWVPGCSTGQEAYSLAIALWEFFDDKPVVRPPVQIFATDLSDAQALERARSGLYPESIEAEISPERLRRFFKKEDHLYRINKAIRDACVFARQNITADPPFCHVDLISCRNVLIYMAPALQKRVLATFHYALNVPGFLVRGSSEMVGEFTELFEALDRAQKIYAKKVTSNRSLLYFNVEDYTAAAQRSGRPAPANFEKEADRIMLGRYAPPGVLVNEHFDILQFRGHTGPYLEAPPGEPTSNLLKMARQGLFLELRSALIEAKERHQVASRESVRVRDGQDAREVTIEVLPVQPGGAPASCYLVLFEEGDAAGAREPSSVALASTSEPAGAPASDSEVSLRQELQATREYLQSLIEQQDAATDELRSANEDLQGTNEELETAKEELQSTNEELSTVNEQLEHRNRELNQTTNDLSNLLASTTIPVLMVGTDLRVRRLTPPARKIMNLLPTDLGRPIGDLTANVDVPDLEALIGEVIEEVQLREREVRDRDGRWYTMRVHPYRTADNKTDGAVLVLLDIDEIKRSEQALKESEQRFARFMQHLPGLAWIKDLQGRYVYTNDAAEKAFGTPRERLYGRTDDEIFPPETAAQFKANDRQVLTDGRAIQVVETLEHENGVVHHSIVNKFPIAGPDSHTMLIGGIAIDITERKRAEEALRQSHAELQSHIGELTRFNRVAVGRELRMIELKKEVNELLQRHGETARYPLEFEHEGKGADA